MDKALEQPFPDYSPRMLRDRVEGVAVGEVLINGQGNVERVRVLLSPRADLVPDIEEALRHWKFSPTKVQGRPVYVLGKVTLYFHIGEGRGWVLSARQSKEKGFRLAAGSPTTITLDVRRRDRYQVQPTDSVNIPLDEIGTRAPIEFAESRLVVVDCTATPYSVCEVAYKKLKRIGFENVTVREGDRRLECPSCPPNHE